MIQIDLTDRVTIVTGASRGIGRAIAVTLAQAGAAVACVARSEGPLKETVSLCEKAGGKALDFVCDIKDQAAVNAVVSNVLENFGRIDVMVNNAGTTRDNLMMRMSDEEWDDVIDTNMKGSFHFCRAVARPMLKQKGGKLINIISATGQAGNVGQANYAASKAGIAAFTKSVAREMSAKGIICNCIAPGYIVTEMSEKLSDKHKERLFDLIPLARTGKPEEVAYAVAFLASDLGNFINGQVINVDGGMVM